MYTYAIFSVSEFEELYKQEDTYDVAHQQFEFCATFSYDHIWVAALAFNCTETFLRETGRLQLFFYLILVVRKPALGSQKVQLKRPLQMQ